MRNLPSISFVISNNRETDLSDAVRSALQQSVPDVEVVIVDEGSAQDPLEALGDLALDPRVRCIQHPSPGGSVARDAGVSASRGPLVCFLDPDYRLVPDFCSRLQAVLQANEHLAVAYCDLHYFFESDGDTVGLASRPHGRNIVPPLLLGTCFRRYLVVAKKPAVEQAALPEINEDTEWDLWLRIAVAGHGMSYVDGDLAYCRLRADNRSLRHLPDSSVQALSELLRLTPEARREPVSSPRENLEHSELEKARARIEWLEESKSWFEKSALSWRNEAERLKDVAFRFENYFQESQAWIGSLEAAKSWHEQQAEYWRREAERRVGSRP